MEANETITRNAFVDYFGLDDNMELQNRESDLVRNISRPAESFLISNSFSWTSLGIVATSIITENGF